MLLEEGYLGPPQRQVQDNLLLKSYKQRKQQKQQQPFQKQSHPQQQLSQQQPSQQQQQQQQQQPSPKKPSQQQPNERDANTSPSKLHESHSESSKEDLKEDSKFVDSKFVDKSGTTLLKCGRCTRMFADKDVLMKHKATQHRMCVKCMRSVSNVNGLRLVHGQLAMLMV